MNKNNCNQKESKILEKIKWLSISSFFMLSIFINYYFYEKQLFLRILIIFFLVICAISILLSTKQGKNILAYITMSKKEIQKIIWPGFKETLYTTCIVIFVTIITSLLLWGLDNVIFRLIAFIISLRF